MEANGGAPRREEGEEGSAVTWRQGKKGCKGGGSGAAEGQGDEGCTGRGHWPL